MLLELESRPGKARSARLKLTDEAADVNGVVFAWRDVTRLLYRAVDQHVNGSYLHTTFTVGLGDAKRTATFMMTSGTTGALKTKIDHETRSAYQHRWGQAVDVLERYAGTRIATEAVDAVRRGTPVELADVRLDGAGIHRGSLFRKTIAWPEYAGVKRENVYLHLLADRAGKTPKARISVPNGSWNVALLPRVLDALHGLRTAG
ncbi:hypothetical protein Dvina_24930 [Dactylosporangium vinaceum]|uniref:Uncharacterized protein n=1 Tax=Dactylosporangium vinaceum TaxID=53362 RepID=A0ABV5MDZ9_9ACTN|nr:hypothetical protein [Dactylosporangium vinaceum]UAC01009.1 hypothetical protein Dvina_24930 [Dactylosporangium vinaceum]